MRMRPNLSRSGKTRSSILKLSGHPGRSLSYLSIQARRGQACGTISAHRRPSVSVPCAAHARIALSQRRNLSSSSRRKGIWDDDDEVSKPAPVQPARSAQPARPYQPLRTAESTNRAARHRNVGSLLRSRVSAKQLADNLARIQHDFEKLPSHDLLIEAFLELKYTHLGDLISESARAVQSYQADAQALTDCLNKQIDDIILQLTHDVAHSERVTQTYVSEFDNLANSIQQRLDAVLSAADARVSEANAVTQQIGAEVETLSSSISKQFTNMVALSVYDVRQAEKVTRGYMVELKRLSSSIQGLGFLDASVSKSQRAIARIDHDFCTIAFWPVPKWSRDIKKSGLEIDRWRVETRISATKILASRVRSSGIAVASLQKQFLWEFLQPRRRAQNRVDGILAPLEQSRVVYSELQRKFAATWEISPQIHLLCRDLSKASSFGAEDALRFAELRSSGAELSLELRRRAHTWRAAWRETQYAKHGLNKMDRWNLNHITRHASKDRKEIVLSTLRGSNEILEANQEKVRAKLSTKYMHLEPSSIYWTQLNTTALFELTNLMMWRLHSEVDYLRFGLIGAFGPLWSWVPRETISSKSHDLSLWCAQFSACRSDFRADFAEFKYLNWLRLLRERQLGIQHRVSEGIKPLEGSQKARELNRLKTALISSRPGSVRPRPWRKSLDETPGEPFTEWLDIMAKCSQDAYLVSAVREFEPAQWEQLYDAWDLARTNQSFTPELGSLVPSPVRLPRNKGTVDSPRASSLHDRHRNSKWLPLPTEATRKRSGGKNRFRYDARKAELRDHEVLQDHPEEQNQKSVGVSTPRRQTQPTTRLPGPKPGVVSSFFNSSRSAGQRGYSTDASSQFSEPQHPSDLSRKILRERTTEDALSSVTCETQPLIEILPADDQAPHLKDEIDANETSSPLFWTHKSQQSPSGDKIVVHYCRSLKSTEAMVQHFLGSKVIGFDMEWKSSASSRDGIKDNVSLIQIANEERIGLFQVALFPGRTEKDLVSPSLKQLIENPDVLKVGVSIKADCTRLRKYLGIDAKATFELSHLFKLVKFGKNEPKLVNKRGVNLSDQVEEHLGLPLDKNEDVRCGDWTRTLNYQQVQYAATDPYACVRLFHVMEAKRKAMSPMPPRPAFAELGQPIIVPSRDAVIEEDILV
ncbi:unnamed protein product [Penicillium olsonii]|nr:unnamed protein product [Penicillium olsonii]CAG7929379.1 unnamed protein product [Penicillium olsonii]